MANSPLFSGTTGGTVKDSDVMVYKEDGASGDPKRIHLFSVMKTYFQGLLPSRITQNESDITQAQSDITDNETDITTLETWNQTGESTEFIIGSGQSGSFSYSSIIGWRETSNDQIRCSVIWDKIPKQATGLGITFPSIFRFIDLDGNQSNQPVSPTISNLSIVGKEVTFFINEVGIITGLSDTQPLFPRINGALTITLS